MSFAVWVQWFEQGVRASVSAAVVERAFGASVTQRDGSRWVLRHGNNDACELRLKPRGPNEVESLAVSRPCDASSLWDAILKVVSEGHGVCYWPGGAAVATLETRAHLPDDMRASLGELTLVASGANIAEAVAHS
jgi:hypothetical protein